MSYIRVLPRDAFNEAKLLKCVGKLTLMIEDRLNSVAAWSFEYDGKPFRIEQNESDGSISVTNIKFYRNVSKTTRERVIVSTGLNSRLNWPLVDGSGEYLFKENGDWATTEKE